MIPKIKHIDGEWLTTEYLYKNYRILIKSRTGHGMKSHAFIINEPKALFTLIYSFITPTELLKRTKAKLDTLSQLQ